MKRCTDARVRAATGKRNGTGGDNDEDPIARNLSSFRPHVAAAATLSQSSIVSEVVMLRREMLSC